MRKIVWLVNLLLALYSMHALGNSFQDDREEAGRLNEKMFLSSGEFCERVANNPSVKAYASIFEKLNTDKQAQVLARDNREYYRVIRMQYLESEYSINEATKGLLQNWVADQIKSENVPYYVEHILSARVLQLAEECAKQHINDALYYFFDPASEFRSAALRTQAPVEEKKVLDADGNLVKEVPREQVVHDGFRAGKPYLNLKGERINVASTNDPKVVSFWALALRNSDNAIKNVAQDRLTNELAKLEQQVFELHEKNEEAMKVAGQARKDAEVAAVQERINEDARFKQLELYQQSREVAFAVFKYVGGAILLLTIFAISLGLKNKGVFFWDITDVVVSGLLSLLVAASLIVLAAVYNDSSLNADERTMKAAIAMLCIAVAYAFNYMKVKLYNPFALAALYACGRLLLPLFMLVTLAFARMYGESAGYSKQATNESWADFEVRSRQLDRERSTKKAQSVVMIAIVLAISAYLYTQLIARKRWGGYAGYFGKTE